MIYEQNENNFIYTSFIFPITKYIYNIFIIIISKIKKFKYGYSNE